MSIAMGQDPEASALLNPSAGNFQLLIPGLCCMEALSVLASKRNERDEFRQHLDRQIRQAQRDRTSPHAKSLLTHLEQSRIENDEVRNEIRVRLYDALVKLAANAILLPLDPKVLQTSLSNEILDDPTDGVILGTIMAHARGNSMKPMAFLSADKQFREKARVTLREVGIDKDFDAAQHFLGWLQSLAPTSGN